MGAHNTQTVDIIIMYLFANISPKLNIDMPVNSLSHDLKIMTLRHTCRVKK